ncbi:M15 family metallopeptidase [Marisediminicola senii]|uniref:M15 family metallopeptidase n=1 Tax=Marisediminicola senii TaxID=2711233 RepID=UPI0013EA1CE9|nr:M15 family metallopeptidase [Marisediminicola senii]
MSQRAGRRTLPAAIVVGLCVALAGCASPGPLTAVDATGSPSSSASASPSAPEPTPSDPPASPSASPTDAAPEPAPPPEPAPAPPAPAGFDSGQRSIDDPASLWVVANKLRPMNPAGFVPPDLAYPSVENANGQPLRAPAGDALVAMFAAAAAEGAGGMRLQSAYRSYDTQVGVYNGYVAREGQASADAQSARPGHSEHQTGLAADISAGSSCILAACFADTPQGSWLAQNAWRFGFILRYPADKVPVTGYMFEPWHFRYVGTELSTELHERGIRTLEEFFGLPAAPGYAG